LFLLSDDLVKRYARRGLRIINADENNFFPTCYYFRLGEAIQYPFSDSPLTSHPIPKKGLTLAPDDQVRVASLEHFRLPEHVMAILGPRTASAVEGGRLLLHGPTVEPGYDARLDLAIKNISPVPINLRTGESIGKIMFYDISDTQLEETRLTDEAQRRMKKWGTDDDNPDAPWQP
jgi:deoxycytidine triphosphate deaminase